MKNEASESASGWKRAGAWMSLAGEVSGVVILAAFGGYKADEALDSSPFLLLGAVVVAAGLVFVRIWHLRRWFL